jgi:hypothetical protein
MEKSIERAMKVEFVLKLTLSFHCTLEEFSIEENKIIKLY